MVRLLGGRGKRMSWPAMTNEQQLGWPRRGRLRPSPPIYSIPSHMLILLREHFVPSGVSEGMPGWSDCRVSIAGRCGVNNTSVAVIEQLYL